MSWRVNAIGGDGNVKTVLKEEWSEVLSTLKTFRRAGTRAWIENAVGEEIDEATGQAKV
jgi:hypothetical protein